MLRGKNIVLLCNCILNQNTVVQPLARAKGPFSFVKLLIDEGIGMIQLPCPEMKHLGLKRKSMTKEEYNTDEYRKLCRDLFIPVLKDIVTYIESGYNLIGIIGINESPTCSITGDRGIFMEEIFKILSESDIDVNYFDVPAMYNDEEYKSIYDKLKEKINI